MAAPEVPAWLDWASGALSCQHSRVDLPLAAAIVVTFKWEGAGEEVDRVKAGPMKVDRLENMRGVRRMMGSKTRKQGGEAGGNGVISACTADLEGEGGSGGS